MRIQQVESGLEQPREGLLAILLSAEIYGKQLQARRHENQKTTLPTSAIRDFLGLDGAVLKVAEHVTFT